MEIKNLLSESCPMIPVISDDQNFRQQYNRGFMNVFNLSSCISTSEVNSLIEKGGMFRGIILLDPEKDYKQDIELFYDGLVLTKPRIVVAARQGDVLSSIAYVHVLTRELLGRTMGMSSSG